MHCRLLPRNGRKATKARYKQKPPRTDQLRRAKAKDCGDGGLSCDQLAWVSQKVSLVSSISKKWGSPHSALQFRKKGRSVGARVSKDHAGVRVSKPDRLCSGASCGRDKSMPFEYPPPMAWMRSTVAIKWSASLAFSANCWSRSPCWIVSISR